MEKIDYVALVVPTVILHINRVLGFKIGTRRTYLPFSYERTLSFRTLETVTYLGLQSPWSNNISSQIPGSVEILFIYGYRLKLVVMSSSIAVFLLRFS